MSSEAPAGTALPADGGLLPTRDEIAALALFERLGLKDITLVATAAEAEEAVRELLHHPVLGFDTESRPIFAAGDAQEGPHVVQFATAERAWVFQLRQAGCRDAVARLLASREVAKVGFGLEGDRSQILASFGVLPERVVDLNAVFRRRGWARHIGAKSAVALVFNRRLLKSKKTTTSNWANATLSPVQLVYAANDAYAAIRVFLALEMSIEQAFALEALPEEPKPPRARRWPRRRRRRRPPPREALA